MMRVFVESIKSEVIPAQAILHGKVGGVVPESRAVCESPVVRENEVLQHERTPDVVDPRLRNVNLQALPEQFRPESPYPAVRRFKICGTRRTQFRGRRRQIWKLEIEGSGLPGFELKTVAESLAGVFVFCVGIAVN